MLPLYMTLEYLLITQPEGYYLSSLKMYLECEMRLCSSQWEAGKQYT